MSDQRATMTSHADVCGGVFQLKQKYVSASYGRRKNSTSRCRSKGTRSIGNKNERIKGAVKK